MWSIIIYPSPSDLDLTCSSESSEGGGSEGHRISANYATARYLVLYGAKFPAIGLDGELEGFPSPKEPIHKHTNYFYCHLNIDLRMNIHSHTVHLC